jgi:hypothetical protein
LTLGVTRSRFKHSIQLLGEVAMAKEKLITLGGIARGHAAEVERVLAGIHGTSGQPLWTADLRAVVRKDDPPEED